MHKLRLNIANKTDIDIALDNFRKSCLRNGLSDVECRNLFDQVEEIMRDLVKRGRELNAIGSQLQVQRVIKTEDCKVYLNVNFSEKQSSIANKLRSLFSRGKRK